MTLIAFSLFVCLGFYVPLENCSTHLRRHHCRWRAANFDLCSELKASEQRGLFSVSHLLWHGASVYNGYLRGPITLVAINERLALELSIPVFTTYVCRGWDSNTQHSACEANVLTHCATAVASLLVVESSLRVTFDSEQCRNSLIFCVVWQNL